MVFSGSHVGRSFSKSYRDLNENYHHYLQRVDCFFREIFLRNLVLPFIWIYLYLTLMLQESLTYAILVTWSYCW